MIRVPEEKSERHLLIVPGLSAQAAIGSCCGAASAAAAIETTLLGWAGVESVTVEAAHDRVVVIANRDAGPRVDDLLWSLRMLSLEHACEDTAHHPNVNPF